MKKILSTRYAFLTGVLLTSVISMSGQVNNDTLKYYYPYNNSNDKAFAITDEMDLQLVDFRTAADSDSVNTAGNSVWYYLKATDGLPDIDFGSDKALKKVKVYGPFSVTYPAAVTQINNSTAPVYLNTTALERDDVKMMTLSTGKTLGLYIVQVEPWINMARIEVRPREPLSGKTGKEDDKPGECIDCVDGEMLEEGDYIISAWVSMDTQPLSQSYVTGPYINVTTSSGTITVTSIIDSHIIDGWQLIEGLFTVPPGNLVFTISLNCANDPGRACYFDDIRFFPEKGSMKTYVYDPVNMRLSAELDERHFATLYEYDEEGQLKRIKKETERGVMTIQETSTKSAH